MKPERLAELRATAEAVNYPAPWTAHEVGEYAGIRVEDSRGAPLLGCLNCGDNAATYEPAEGKHIATFDPTTVLELLDEIALLRRYRSVPPGMVWQDYYSPDEVIEIREELQAEIDRLQAEVVSS